MTTTKAPKAKKVPKPPAPPKTKFTPTDLVPPLDGLPSVSNRIWFWCGVFPTCPKAQVHVGAASFRTITEDVRVREGGSSSIRTPTIGGLMPLTRSEMEAIATTLARSMIKFHEGPVEITTSGIDAMYQKRRRGTVVRILSEEELQVRRDNDIVATGYTRNDNDEPLADHLFMVPCESQTNPRAGLDYPEPLSKTGLEWPTEE